MVIKELKKELCDLEPKDFIVQFISADYKMYSEQERNMDRIFHVRDQLYHHFPIENGYYYRRCLRTGHILNVVLKYFYWGKATLHDLEYCLRNLRAYCEEHQLSSLIFTQSAFSDFYWLDAYALINDVFYGWYGEISILFQRGDKENPAA